MLKYGVGIKTPIKVSHYLTYRCNLSCDMCGRRLIDSKLESELKTEQVIELQKNFKKNGTLVWSFSGGECLIRDDILEVSTSVKELGMSLIIVTNGTLLSHKEEILDFADIINVSIDGNEETHDKLRGKGNYQRVIKGLEVLKDNGKKSFKSTIQTILSNETIEPPILDHMLKLAMDYNCKVGFNLAVVHRSDIRKDNAKKYIPTNQQFNTFVNWFKKKYRAGYGKFFLDSPRFFESLGDYPTNPTRIKCYAGKYQCSIDPFGRIMPCCDLFDFEDNYQNIGVNWDYGFSGFKNMKTPVCPYKFCCTTKNNFYLGNPLLILDKYVFR